MRRVDFVWFDFGGVLSPPIPALFEQYATKTGIPPAALQHAMRSVAEDIGVPMLAPIENAMLSEREWGRRLRHVLSRHEPALDLTRAELENFGRQWFDGVPPNWPMVDAVHALRQAGMAVGILTNNVIEWEPHWRRMLDLDDVVNFILDSSKERCRKPEVKFFDTACQRSGVSAERSLLIDDVEENVCAARNLGWQTILFTQNDEVLKKISQYTGISLP